MFNQSCLSPYVGLHTDLGSPIRFSRYCWMRRGWQTSRHHGSGQTDLQEHHRPGSHGPGGNSAHEAAGSGLWSWCCVLWGGNLHWGWIFNALKHHSQLNMPFSPQELIDIKMAQCRRTVNGKNPCAVAAGEPLSRSSCRRAAGSADCLDQKALMLDLKAASFIYS